MRNKYLLPVIILLVVVGAGLIWSVQKRNQETSPDNDSTIVDNEEVDNGNWEEYKNGQFGFEFKYPTHWNLNDLKENDVMVSVSNYFNNEFGQKDGSKISIAIEENKYGSFEEWLRQNYDIFENETIYANENFSFKDFPANLVKSGSPIAGGYNDRLSVFDEQKNRVFVIWTHRRIRVELQEENQIHEKTANHIVSSLKIDN